MSRLRRWLQVVLCGAVCAAAGNIHAAETLTPEEIADGWILLFDGETTFGWKTEGDVTVHDGVLQVGGEKPGSVELMTPLGSGELVLETGAAGPGDLTYMDGRGTVDAGLTAQPNSVHHTVTVDQQGSGIAEDLKTEGNRVIRTGEVTVKEPTFRLRLSVHQGLPLHVKSLKFRPSGLKPIFNGKYLTGWKAIPDKKSRFAVTDAGELSIKDGNGDLQTEAEWDDFVLQLEIKTNGTHLNSGVFFRALPGQFWSGYEAQIRNQWEGDDRTKPVDFGTGGVYNQQPARRVVSSDNEWFTMTIMATGKHIAVWVNGIQVSDFTDPRPANESARRGSKTGPGVISLQGHDPTTDLSFRNIRIVPLKAVAAD